MWEWITRFFSDNQILDFDKTEFFPLPLVTPCERTKVTERDGKKIISYGASAYWQIVRLSDRDFRIFSPADGDSVVTDPKDFKTDRILKSLTPVTDESGTYFILPPLTSALGVSKEKIALTGNMVSFATGKLIYQRCGVVISIPVLEPDWQGHLTIAMFNATSVPVKIYANEGIAQLMFHESINNWASAIYIGTYPPPSETIDVARIDA